MLLPQVMLLLPFLLLLLLLHLYIFGLPPFLKEINHMIRGINVAELVNRATQLYDLIEIQGFSLNCVCM